MERPRVTETTPYGARIAKRFPQESTMPGLLPNVDPDGLLEFSVVYTDRALNHMSRKFQGVMRPQTPTGSRTTREL